MARDRSEVARALKQLFYPRTGNGGHRWCLSSSLSLLVGFSIQDETTDVARSAPQDVIYLPPFTGNKEGSKSLMILRVKPTPTRLPTNSRYTPMDNTPLHSIPNVCHSCGYMCCHIGDYFCSRESVLTEG